MISEPEQAEVVLVGTIRGLGTVTGARPLLAPSAQGASASR
jgi:hypothetical protein